jgi:hypothetical protein
MVPPEQYLIFRADAPWNLLTSGGVGMVRARLRRAPKTLQQSLWRIVETERIADGPGGGT